MILLARRWILTKQRQAWIHAGAWCLLITILNFGCDGLNEKILVNHINQRIGGSWTIDRTYYHNKPAFDDLLSNSFSLNDDQSCDLPTFYVDDEDNEKQKGTWKAYQRNDTIYVKITTKNKLFSRAFRLQNFRRDTSIVGQQTAIFTRATFVADSLRLDCTKSPF